MPFFIAVLLLLASAVLSIIKRMLIKGFFIDDRIAGTELNKRNSFEELNNNVPGLMYVPKDYKKEENKKFYLREIIIVFNVLAPLCAALSMLILLLNRG